MRNTRLLWKLAVVLLFTFGCRQGVNLETPSLPISSGLLAGEVFCEKAGESGCKWEASNEAQRGVLEDLQATRPLITGTFPGLTSIADSDVGVVNAFLKKEGVPITLPSVGKDGLAMAGILSLHGAWALGGERTTLEVDQNTYPAAELKGAFAVYRWRGYTGVAISTQGEEIVHLIPMDKGDADSFLREFQPVLAGWDWESKGDLRMTGDEFNRLVFPLVDHTVVNDLNDLVGMRLGPFTLQVAKMAKTIKMDQLGFISKTGFAAGAMRGEEPRPNPFVIDTAFLFLVQREGVPFPLEAEWVPRSSWKDPGNLAL